MKNIAFTSHHLDDCHSELVSEFTTYQNWRKLPPLKGEGWGEGSTSFCKAFTLAEVLITLAIIGVVAAMAIPSVISNAQQSEFKTGLRKAVSVLNSAIAMNIALDGESPYENGDLFRYLQRHMSVMKSTTRVPWTYKVWRISTDSNMGYGDNLSYGNSAFYTTDGMRFEFWWSNNFTFPYYTALSLEGHEGLKFNILTTYVDENNPPEYRKNMRCGSYGLVSNPNNTTARPCKIMVDVNGDRKPFPANINATVSNENKLKVLSPNSKKVNDTFSIMITEDRAIPYGVLAQKAMYQAQK